MSSGCQILQQITNNLHLAYMLLKPWTQAMQHLSLH